MVDNGKPRKGIGLKVTEDDESAVRLDASFIDVYKGSGRGDDSLLWAFSLFFVFVLYVQYAFLFASFTLCKGATRTQAVMSSSMHK